MGPIISSLTPEQATGLNGTVIDLDIIDPGSGYTTGTNICTYSANKFDAIKRKPINEFLQDSLGCDKVDVLHVDITVGPDGEILTAEPNNEKRGFFYRVGDTVSVKKTGTTDFAILQVTRVWPE